MLPATDNLSMYRGDSVRFTKRLRTRNEDGTSGDYIVLTNCVPKAQIRASATDATVLLEFNVILGDQATKPGEVIFSIPAGATDSMPNGAMWDFQLTHPDGAVRTYLAGTVTFDGQVTK